ncbi:hypothetical protein KFL_001910110 [Klebsormidium nitens]|uniref:EGF-like domain-containing protein n=1 Tax=Klebsormidium nitens TaxID=105231 RepID=A0A1Y1I3G0_KLENI|nr:hypothetical protein KFL_001910110 [Klebsormidium nitens]|eukprot:GAQ84492.1 hypothetical protein KFL_001910110 [Klebsormidium nitens]
MDRSSWQCRQNKQLGWRPAGLLILVTLSSLLNPATAQSTPCGPSLNCVNGALCNETPESATGGVAYLCACLNGFSGPNCETKVTASGTGSTTCGPNLLCLNGGVCNETPGAEAGGGGAYLCACPNGFNGQDCGTPCGGVSQAPCSPASTASSSGPTAAPLPTTSTPTSAPVTPSPVTTQPASNPVVNPGPVPTATQACGPSLVCQHGGVCNQTPGAQEGDTGFCACLDGFTGLDCSVDSTGQNRGSTTTQATNGVAPVITPTATSSIRRASSGGGGVKVWVIVVAVVAALAGVVLVGAVLLLVRRRRSAGGALAYQRRDSAHAQMSSLERRGDFAADV